MKQRILVLGASGFIGKRVTDALASSDWATAIPAGRRTPTEPNGVRLNATDSSQMRLALDGVDGIVNCVAGDGTTIVESARTLFAIVASMPRRPRVVHLSSMAVYGSAVGAVDESLEPKVGLSPYGAAKRQAELLASPDLPLVILRPGIVYGPGSTQWSERIAKLLYAHRLGDLGKAGDGFCNLVYIEDAVSAILSALRSSNIKGRIFNLSLPRPPTWNEYFIRYAMALEAVPVARITRRKLKIETKLFAPPQKIAEVLAHRFAPKLAHFLPPPIPPSLIGLFGQEIRLKVDAIEKTLGLRWTPIEEGLERTAARYSRISTLTNAGSTW